jgi:phosphocarrier protein FPr
MTRRVLSGQGGSPGVAVGHLLWVPGAGVHGGADRAGSGSSDGARLDARRSDGAAFATDPDEERRRLADALAEAASALEAIARETAGRAGPEIGEIFSAQALFARDPGLVEPAEALIRAGATAVEAIDRVAAEGADQLASVDDAYFRERAADLRDVGRRVVDLLLGRAAPALHRSDGAPAILVAIDLDPSLVAAIRPELVAGMALAAGAANGHTAIVARALGIPLALDLGIGLDSSLDDCRAVVDGDAGRLIVEPDEDDLRAATPLPMGDRSGGGADGPGAPDRAGPAVIVAGRAADVANSADVSAGVAVAANVGSLAEAQGAARAGADAIGLVRTELIFLGRTTPPGLAEQRGLYARISAAMAGRPVVFRTLDVGGDKPAGFEPSGGEANPALGVRGLRLGLRRPDLLETQVRAIVEAAPEAAARILLPMVSTIDEIRLARLAIEAAIARSREGGAAVSEDVRIGVMVEVPALALMADHVVAEVDFVSIGTNDLVQYALAADRTNAALADLASPFEPAILRLVDMTCRAAAAAGRPVTVCGEAAADPLMATLLIGLGVTELSVSPRAVGPVRATVGALAGRSAGEISEAARRAVAASTADEARSIAAGALRLATEPA